MAYLLLLLHLNLVTLCLGWQYFTYFEDIVMQNSVPEPRQGYIFIPFGVETLGPWGPEAHKLYKHLASEIIKVSGGRRAVVVHSEYLFGDCLRASKLLMAHAHLDHFQVLGKKIIRGWLNINRIPICIIIKARSHPNDSFRSTSYNFQICVSRITFLHSQKRFRYFYYEWNLPDDMIGGMDWDLYFYGPISDSW